MSKKKTKTSKKSRFTKAQNAAYNSGKGYSIARNGRKINFSSDDLKNSFLAGYQAGSEKIKASPKKYPKLK